MRRTAIAAVVVAGLAGTLTAAAPAAPATTWAARADALIDRTTAADSGDESVIGYAMLTQAMGHIRGWDDVGTSHYLSLLLGKQHADGGFGLEQGWDTWGDGSVNPSSTAYTVSMAGHAWPALRDALPRGIDVEAEAQRSSPSSGPSPTSRSSPACACLTRTSQRSGRILRPQRQRRSCGRAVRSMGHGFGTPRPELGGCWNHPN